MLGKSLIIVIIVEFILVTLAVISCIYKWNVEAVVVAVMGFAFIVYWDYRKEKQFITRESHRVGRAMLNEITFNLRVMAENKAIRDKCSGDVPVRYYDASWHALSAGGYLLVLPDDLVEKLSNLYRSILDSNRFIERIEELTVGVGQALSSAPANRQALQNWVFDRLDGYENSMTEIKAMLSDFLGGG